MSWVIKEVIFKSYGGWLESEGIASGGSLNIFINNFHSALFSLPFTVLTAPLVAQTLAECRIRLLDRLAGPPTQKICSSAEVSRGEWPSG